MRRFVCEDYPVDRLPRDLHPLLPTGRRVRVVIEDAITDAELRQELDREIGKGLKSLDEGRSYTAEEVLDWIEARSEKAAAAE
jgi:predicted transcriptional regulator